MAYPYAARNRAKETEVLVFEKTVDNTTAASGVKTYDINLPVGSYQVGVTLSSNSAGANATAKVYAYQTPQQSTVSIARSDALAMLPLGGTATVTVLTAAATSIYSGTHGQLSQGASQTVPFATYPYGLQLSVTCNTNSGSTTYKVVAQQRT